MTVNPSANQIKRALIIGAGAIGSALAKHLVNLGEDATPTDASSVKASALASAEETGACQWAVDMTWHQTPPKLEHPRLRSVQLDPTSEADIIRVANYLTAPAGEQPTAYDWIINCTGFLSQGGASASAEQPARRSQPEKRLADVEPEFFMENMRVNALTTLLLAKHLGALLHDQPSAGPAIFAALSAKVGSISDNRLGGWYSYRASKAALNMALKTLSIEWQRRYKHRCVVALHPGTTQSALSQPFSKNVPAAKYFSPEQTADYLIRQLMSLTAEHTGEFIAWSGERLGW